MEGSPGSKRVFFAFEVHAPWPASLPQGRVLNLSGRHLTIAFLGDVDYPSLEKILNFFPPPKIRTGLTGKFDRCLFLPPQRPNVVSWHVKWLDQAFDLGLYQKELAEWLSANGFHVKLHSEGFLPHVTLSRRPFHYREWRDAFEVLPLYIKDIHLYESKSGLNYAPLWSHPLLAPFESTHDTDGVAITVRGESLTSLLNHCITAIAFFHPGILAKYPESIDVQESAELLPIVEDLLVRAGKKNPKLPSSCNTVEVPKFKDQIFTWKVILN